MRGHVQRWGRRKKQTWAARRQIVRIYGMAEAAWRTQLQPVRVAIIRCDCHAICANRSNNQQWRVDCLSTRLMVSLLPLINWLTPPLQLKGYIDLDATVRILKLQWVVFATINSKWIPEAEMWRSQSAETALPLAVLLSPVELASPRALRLEKQWSAP